MVRCMQAGSSIGNKAVKNTKTNSSGRVISKEENPKIYRKEEGEKHVKRRGGEEEEYTASRRIGGGGRGNTRRGWLSSGRGGRGRGWLSSGRGGRGRGWEVGTFVEPHLSESKNLEQQKVDLEDINDKVERRNFFLFNE